MATKMMIHVCISSRCLNLKMMAATRVKFSRVVHVVLILLCMMQTSWYWSTSHVSHFLSLLFVFSSSSNSLYLRWDNPQLSFLLSFAVVFSASFLVYYPGPVENTLTIPAQDETPVQNNTPAPYRGARDTNSGKYIDWSSVHRSGHLLIVQYIYIYYIYRHGIVQGLSKVQVSSALQKICV